MQRIDFSYEISDARLASYSRVPILDRLRWLDEVRIFTLMVRQAPTAPKEARDTGADRRGGTVHSTVKEP